MYQYVLESVGWTVLLLIPTCYSPLSSPAGPGGGVCWSLIGECRQLCAASQAVSPSTQSVSGLRASHPTLCQVESIGTRNITTHS